MEIILHEKVDLFFVLPCFHGSNERREKVSWSYEKDTFMAVLWIGTTCLFVLGLRGDEGEDEREVGRKGSIYTRENWKRITKSRDHQIEQAKLNTEPSGRHNTPDHSRSVIPFSLLRCHHTR